MEIKTVTAVPEDGVIIVNDEIMWVSPYASNIRDLEVLTWNGENGVLQFEHGAEIRQFNSSEYSVYVQPEVDRWLAEKDRLLAEISREQTTEEKSVAIRAERDALLAATDYMMMPDYPMSDADRDALRAYRQALRGIPEQPGFPNSVVWPIKGE